MKCLLCEKEMGLVHSNRLYCSQKCADEARYLKNGQRCTSDQRKEWYTNRCKKDGYKEKLNSQSKKQYEEVQNFLRNYKISEKCKDCGYDEHHAALEFDHVRGIKKLNVCLSKSINQAQEEIKKCEVVCANCHKIRTFERLQKNKKKNEEDLNEPLN